MRTALAVLAPSILLLLLPVAVHGQKTSKETLTSGGKQRTYYLFVPESVRPVAAGKSTESKGLEGKGSAVQAPLLITLHGSGHDGKSLVSYWDRLAKKEGFVVVGPDAVNPEGWRSPVDGPDFLHELVDSLSARLPIDPRRIYLFGHSAGAVFALNLSLMESEFFAATAVHAGSWRRPE